MDGDLEKSEVDRINIFHAFVKARMDKITEATVEKEIFKEASRLEIQNKATIVLCELLLGETIIAQTKKHKRIFLRFTSENQKAQKYLIGGIEKTIELKKNVLLSKVAGIFKTFYDEDILDEEVILEWAKKVSKKYVSKELSEQIHKKADPFIKWLKEAEEESSDEESDVELEFDEKAKISSLKEKKEESPVKEQNGNGNGKQAEEEEEDDLDIDDI